MGLMIVKEWFWVLNLLNCIVECMVFSSYSTNDTTERILETAEADLGKGPWKRNAYMKSGDSSKPPDC